MGKYAYRFAPVHYTDIDGMESWLEDMAAKGLVLGQEGIYYGLTAFEKTTPKRYKYRLIASTHKYSKGRERNRSYAPEPEEKTREFHREFGWEYVATRKDFHIYCAKDPNAPEMDTDPRIQATAIHAAAKRRLWDFLWIFLCAVLLAALRILSYFQFMLGLSRSINGIYHFLFITGILLIYGVTTFYGYFRLKGLEKRLLSGQSLTHRADYRRNRGVYWLGRCAEPLFFIAVLCLLNAVGFRWDYISGTAVPLDSYTQPIPFATLEELLPGVELREDKSWDETVEERNCFPAKTLILHQQQHISLPDGQETSGALDVTHCDTRFEWIAELAYWNAYREAPINSRIELHIDGADEAFVYEANGITYAAIRRGSIFVEAELVTYFTHFHSAEEFAQLIADSIQ